MNKLKILTLSMILVMVAVFAVPRVLPAQAAAPANDDFYNASVVASLPFTEVVDITEATTAYYDPYPCGYYPSNSVWYSFTPANTVVVQISTDGSSFSTVVGVYTGDPGSGFSQQACQPGGGTFSAILTGGITYAIMVAGNFPYPGQEGGTLNLSITELPRPANDDFADAIIVPAMPYQDTVDNASATSEPGEPAGCSYAGPQRTIWYAYTPSEEGLLTGDASFDNYSFLAVYTGNAVDSLTELTCTNYDGSIQLSVSPGTTYYIQLGSLYDWNYGYDTLRLNFTPAPPNDDFANAMIVGDVPFSSIVNNTAASTEDGEPDPGCTWGGISRTLWYAFTPSSSGSITFMRGGFYGSFSAVYTGSSLNSLTLLRCGFSQFYFTLPVEAGVTYYIQLGSANYDYYYGDLSLDLFVPGPPNADFWWSPSDPSQFDNILFCDSSYDFWGEAINLFRWDFGDATQIETNEGCVNHQYPSDGDYTAWHQVQTVDGRTDEMTSNVSVRTHDVTITKFFVPKSASAGQTRTITVGLKNVRYPETVEIRLYKNTPWGWTEVGQLIQYVPVRGGNRTTDFLFSYTFTPEDAETGKVVFRAVASIQGNRDALPADNEAISQPVKVGR